MNITLTSDITARTTVYAMKKLLKRGQYVDFTNRFGQTYPLPKNHGRTAKFRRFEPLVPAIAPLSEGVTPPGQKIRVSDVAVTINQYGDFTPISDWVYDTHEDPVLNQALDVLGEQVGDTVALLNIAVLKSGSSVFYAGNAASRTTIANTISRGDLYQIIRSLKKNKATPITKMVKATTNIATEPLGSSFIAMCSTDLEADWEKVPGYKTVEFYSDSDRALPGEHGRVGNFRVMTSGYFEPWEQAATSVSTNEFLSAGVPPSAAAIPDVYPIIIVGTDSYGIVPLQGENVMQPYVVNPKAQIGDELAQKGFAAWKGWHACVILQQLWIKRYEVLCTAKPN